jgi:hypothetical protein
LHIMTRVFEVIEPQYSGFGWHTWKPPLTIVPQEFLDIVGRHKEL